MFISGRVEFENVLVLFRNLLVRAPQTTQVVDSLYRVNVALYANGNVRAALHHARETIVELCDRGVATPESSVAVALADSLMPRLTPKTSMFSMN